MDPCQTPIGTAQQPYTFDGFLPQFRLTTALKKTVVYAHE